MMTVMKLSSLLDQNSQPGWRKRVIRNLLQSPRFLKPKRSAPTQNGPLNSVRADDGCQLLCVSRGCTSLSGWSAIIHTRPVSAIMCWKLRRRPHPDGFLTTWWVLPRFLSLLNVSSFFLFFTWKMFGFCFLGFQISGVSFILQPNNPFQTLSAS